MKALSFGLLIALCASMFAQNASSDASPVETIRMKIEAT